ncbi:hypothetical protein HELRODRAFT_144964, partial [Helobdella robusta]|uniref:TIR domain-containing protein n=1 Tax=Helobdella robusta TaxID=6412 RepID=T1EJH4_HELRO
SGEHMEYDAFVSCAYADRERAIEMINMLESRGYKICYHEKDFVPGKPIALNILEAVLFSKRVLCLMTLDFINSPYCLFEFQISLHRNIEIKKKRLIVLMDGSVKVDQCSLPTDLYNFLSSHTYIK